MQVLVLSDGRPGHFKQSRGVLKAIERFEPMDLEWTEVRLRTAAFRPLLRWWWNRIGWRLPLFCLHLFYQMPKMRRGVRPDLIVSSGGNTLYANVWLAKHFGCRNLFIGTLRRMRTSLFSGVVTPDATRKGKAPYIVSLPPTAIEPQHATQAADAYRVEYGLPVRPRWTLLIGGACPGYKYTRRDWRTILDALQPLAEEFGVRWLITTSRRTSRRVERMLEGLRESACVDDLLIFRTDNRNLFSAFLGSAEIVFCTEDSAMMLSEAVVSGRRVIALRPEGARPGKKNQMLLNLYHKRGLLEQIPIAEFSTTRFDTVAASSSNIEPDPMKELHQQMERFLRAA